MKFFDALAETRVTRNRLPHWQQDGATYFITYRLADSIPQVLMNQWRQDREHWMELLLAENFSNFDGKRYLLHSCVIMPNHVHLLLSMAVESWLEKAVTSWKNYTSKRINAITGEGGAFWQKDYFDRIIRDWDHFANVARYIRRNPVKVKLEEGHYRLFEDETVKRILG